MRKLLTLCTLAALVSVSTAQVVINEIMYNPPGDLGLDDYFEYLELTNAGDTAVDISSWQVIEAIDFTFPAGTILDPAEYLVIARNLDSLETHYGALNALGNFDGALSNGGEDMYLVNAVGDTMDWLVYDDGGDWTSAPDGDGPSLELLNPLFDNTLAANWAASTINLGTPGAENSVYTSDAPPEVSNGGHAPIEPNDTETITISATITDDFGVTSATLYYDAGSGYTSASMSSVGDVYSALIGPFADDTIVEWYLEAIDTGAQSTIYPEDALAGGLAYLQVMNTPIPAEAIVINEIMYSDGCNSTEDWVELINTTGDELDLSAWIFSDSDPAHVFRFPAGTLIPAGGYLVVSGDAAELATFYTIDHLIGDFSFGLSSGGDEANLLNVNAVLKDHVAYGVSAPWPTAPAGNGPSLSLIDPALDNTLPESWEASAAPCGTPGQDNAQDVWGPEITESGMVSETTIDLQFNEEINSIDAGNTANYTLDGTVHPISAVLDAAGEIWVHLIFADEFTEGIDHSLLVENIQDLADPANAMTATTLTMKYFPVGSVVINEIMNNPSAVADGDGEWLELFNPRDVSVNLSGWMLTDDGTNSHLISPALDLVLPANGFLVLGRSTDPGANGGAAVDYAYGTDYTLGNGDDEVVLSYGLLEIDRVAYDGGPQFPDPNGASMELRNPQYDNNVGDYWSTATTSFGLGDLGTPGAVNSTWEELYYDGPVVTITVNGNDVHLEWTAIPGATSYMIYHALEAFGTFAPLMSTADLFVDLSGEAYGNKFYKVTAEIE